MMEEWCHGVENETAGTRNILGSKTGRPFLIICNRQNEWFFDRIDCRLKAVLKKFENVAVERL